MSQDQDQQERRTVAEFCRQVPRRYLVFGAVLGIVMLILIIWFLPYWQVPAAGLSLKDRLHQINENRKTVAQIVGGVFILVGLYIAWVRSEAARKMAEVNREQQLTDLYVKAIEQLGSENLQIRLGGIYALERIARESAKDHWPIMEVLTAFVRENAPLRKEAPTGEAVEDQSLVSPEAAAAEPQATPETSEQAGPPPPPEKPPTDIQAVLTVLGRTAIYYAQEGEKRSLNLRATHLVGADLAEANLQRALFREANLQGTYLREVNLQGASLREANLQEADLSLANLQEADLYVTNLLGAFLVKANLQGAIFVAANLQGARLGLADLQEADLYGANLHGAELLGANLGGAKLIGAKLQGANFRSAKGLTPIQVAQAIWDETTKWPEGFSPPPRQ
jgi:hypothetical protein